MTESQEKTISEIVAANPSTARVFERYHIDYCCGGMRSLEQACAEQGVSAAEVLTELDAPSAEPQRDWRSASLSELAEHIVSRHHTYLRSELPRLKEMLAKVNEAHGARHGATLRALRQTLDDLVDELTSHMQKEEVILFPFVQLMEEAEKGKATPPMAPGGSVNNPIRVMEHEHDSAASALQEIRAVTSDYQPPEDACNTFRALYQALSELEQDLHMHIHLENNILFPKAGELEARVVSH